MNFDFSTKGVERHTSWTGPYDAVNVALPWGGPKRFVWPSHHHEALELVSIPNGVRGHVVVNGCFYPIDQAIFLSFPPGHIHSYDLHFDGTPPYVVLLIHPALLPQTLSLFPDCTGEELGRKIDGMAYQHKSQTPILSELVFKLSKVRGWLHKESNGRSPISAAVEDTQILFDIIGRLFTAEPAPRLDVRENTPVKRAIAAVERDFRKPLTLDTLARDSSASKYHLCRLFKAQTGTSLWTYVNSVRIRNAVSLLSAGDKNITQVCYECGFADPSYFAKVFKRHTGVTPKKWGTMAAAPGTPLAGPSA